jgi:glycosyltransferase involved in cell wall biosynthesis
MIIGYDAKRVFHNFTGLGNYSRTLLKNMFHNFPENQYILFTPSASNNPGTQFFQDKNNFEIVQPPPNKTNFLWRSFYQKKEIYSKGLNIFHGLSNELPIGLKQKSIVTIHDLIFKHRPLDYPIPDRWIYNLKFKKACHQAELVIAISQATKNVLMEFYHLPEQKIKVLYQSCDSNFYLQVSDKQKSELKAKYLLPENFLLYIGSVIPRKNLLNLVKAIEILPPSLKIPLVIIGEGSSYKREVEKYILEKNLSPLIYWRKIAYQELPVLYQSADVFIYPSFVEGFGIPVLEALASGTPVITSKFSSLPEAGGPNSVYVDPTSPEEISFGIQKILEDELFKNTIVQKGKEFSANFDGKTLSNQLMTIYRDIA